MDWKDQIEDIEAHEAFFAPITPELKVFAARYNLSIETYHHRRPLWTFFFRCPQDGVGQVALHRSGETAVARI